MSWLDALKKNDKEFEKKIVDNTIIEEVLEINNELKDIEEEFDYTFSSTITDIKIDFKDYIERLALPFLDNDSANLFTDRIGVIRNNDFNFYDFIKYNSENFVKLSEKIEKENEEYENEMEEEDYYDFNYEGEQA
jgi:hypothetical protein